MSIGFAAADDGCRVVGSDPADGQFGHVPTAILTSATLGEWPRRARDLPRRPERRPARGRADDRRPAARDRRRRLGQDARAHLPRRAPARRGRASSRTRSSRSRSRTRRRGRCGSGSSARSARSRAAIWILTFHSACGRILRREAERLGYRSNFTIYDQADQVRLVKACLEELERDPKRFVPRGIHTQISNAKNQLIGRRRVRARGSRASTTRPSPTSTRSTSAGCSPRTRSTSTTC